LAQSPPFQVATRINIPEDLSKPTLVGAGGGGTVGASTLVDMFGEKLLRKLLPPALQNMALDQLRKMDARVAMFLAAPPDSLKNAESFAKNAGVFFSFTLPGAPRSLIVTISPGARQSFQVGVGKTMPIAGGKGLVMMTVYAGGKNLAPGGVPAQGTANGLVAVLGEVPFSKDLLSKLAMALDAVGTVAEAGAVVSTAGAASPGVAAAHWLKKLGVTLLKSGRLYMGPAYGVTVSPDGRDDITVQRGKRQPVPLDKAAGDLLPMTLNGGSPEAARLQAHRLVREGGATIFQVAAVSGGRNQGLPWIDLVNRLNHTLQSEGLLQRRVPELPAELRDKPPGEYAVFYENLNNGQQAVELLGQLRNRLLKIGPAKWEAVVESIRPLAVRYGLNFGLKELERQAGDPSPTIEDRAIGGYFQLDWRKGKAQEKRVIEPPPRTQLDFGAS
jgi:hypothetical protein